MLLVITGALTIFKLPVADYPEISPPQIRVQATYSGASAEVLKDIVDAVGKDMTILVDGGIRSGTDVFKALAIGADGVLICRPFVTAVYGGGNKVSTNKTEVFLRKSDNQIPSVYGGGNQAGVPETNVYGEGAKAQNVFGGSNSSGTVNNTYVETKGHLSCRLMYLKQNTCNISHNFL